MGGTEVEVVVVVALASSSSFSAWSSSAGDNGEAPSPNELNRDAKPPSANGGVASCLGLMRISPRYRCFNSKVVLDK